MKVCSANCICDSIITSHEVSVVVSRACRNKHAVRPLTDCVEPIYVPRQPVYAPLETLLINDSAIAEYHILNPVFREEPYNMCEVIKTKILRVI